MIYLSPPTKNSAIYTIGLRTIGMDRLGFIITPDSSTIKYLDYCSFWCADNACFSRSREFDESRFLDWLFWLKVETDISRCLFVTAPDVVGCFESTLRRSAPWLPLIRSLGFRVAFVAQDGFWNPSSVDWDSFDVLFVGGTDEYKLGEEVVFIIKYAKAIGKWVHVGRVNSRSRYEYFKSLNCDSADGTYVVFGPIINICNVRSWVYGD